MITLMKSQERGQAHHGWLKSQHSFSFADYYNPQAMGFRSLRVINEDRVAGGGGFPPHSHRDMEIITYMVQGALEHQDSLGNKAIIRPGELQRMSAGTGVTHSEFNASSQEEAHFFQIWILTNKKGHTPGYGQKDFSAALKQDALVLAASMEGREGSISLNQDVDLYLGRLGQNESQNFTLQAERHAWIQLVKGELDINGHVLMTGDGAAISEEKQLELKAVKNCEFLLFDLN